MTAPTPNALDLVSLNDVKRWLGKEGDASTADDLLGRLITATSQEVATFLQRPIFAANYTEVFNGNGHDRRSTKNYPIIAVTGVTVNGYSISPRPSLATPGFSLGPINGSGLPAGYTNDDIQVYVVGWAFAKGVQNCVINYTAGYISKALGTWANGTVTAGTLLQDGNGNTVIATVGGATGGVAPTWPTTIGQTVQDGAVTWQLGMYGQPAVVPYDLVQAVIEGIGHIFKSKEHIGLAEQMQAQAGSTRYMLDFPVHCMRTIKLYQRATGF